MKYTDLTYQLAPHIWYDPEDRYRRRGGDPPDEPWEPHGPRPHPPVHPPPPSRGIGHHKPTITELPLPPRPPIIPDPPPPIDIPPPVTNGGSGHNNLQNSPNRPQKPTERILTTNALGLTIPVVYGQTKIGGSVIFQPTVVNGHLITAFALCEGEIEEVISITVDGRDIGGAVINGQQGLQLSAGIGYNVHLGTTGQGVDALLHLANPAHVTGWPGLAYIAVAFPPQTVATGEYDPSRIVVELKGRKVLDPRVDLTTYTYSSNPDLHTFDLMTNPTYGLGIPFANMDAAAGSATSSWAVAADDCDFALSRTATPGAAPTVFSNIPGAGLLGPGTYAYTITYTGASGIESVESAASGSVSVPLGNVVTVHWSVGPAGTTTQKLYRNKSSSLGITTPKFLVATFNNNTTNSYADLIADNALGVQSSTQYHRYEMGIMLREALAGSEWLNTLRAHFQAYLAYNTGVYQIFVDKAKFGTSIAFTDDNIKDTPSIRSKGLIDVPTRVVVTFSDSQNDYTEGTAQVELPGVATRTEEIRELRLNLPGVRTFDQAMRLAQLNLNRGAADRVIDFTVLADGVQPLPGDIVKVTSVIGLSDTSVLVTDVQPDNNGLLWHIKGEFYDAAIYSDTVQAYPIALVPGLVPPVPDPVTNIADTSYILTSFLVQGTQIDKKYIQVSFTPSSALNVVRYRARLGLIADTWDTMTKERVIPADYRLYETGSKASIDFFPELSEQVNYTPASGSVDSGFEWKVIVRAELVDGTQSTDVSVQQSPFSSSSFWIAPLSDYVVAQASSPGGPQTTTLGATAHFNISGYGTAASYAIPLSALTLANGLNSDVFFPDSGWSYITGPSGAFSLGGLAGALDGLEITIYNSTTQTWTIVNEDASSAATNRIKCPGAVNMTVGARYFAAVLRYDGTAQRWIVVASSGSGGGGGGGGLTSVQKETPTGTINGLNAVFTIAHAPTGSIYLRRNRAPMIEGTDYTRVTSTITYAAGNIPAGSDVHEVDYQY